MHSVILSLTVVAKLVAAQGLRPRDPASDAAAFTSAADALISAYIPTNEWVSLTAAVGSAARAASVTEDIGSLVYSALKATEAPEWFASAVPSAYSSQYAALESAIEEIRPTAAATPIPTVIAVTTTDADGNTITTSISATVTPVPTTITTDLVTTPRVSVVTGTDLAGSVFTSTVAGATEATATDSAVATATDTVTDTAATESATVTESDPDATPTDATATDATGTESPNAAAPSAMTNGLAGVAAMVGILVAL